MLPSIFNEPIFDHFFPFDSDFFGGYGNQPRMPLKAVMKTDVKETDNGYEMDVDLPGYRKEDVQLDLRNGYLTIHATKKDTKDQTDANGRYIRQERYSGSCSRSFYVGDMTPQDVSARFEDGILKLSLPKQDARQIDRPTYIPIE